jgi:hypothetical protein
LYSAPEKTTFKTDPSRRRGAIALTMPGTYGTQGLSSYSEENQRRADKKHKGRKFSFIGQSQPFKLTERGFSGRYTMSFFSSRLIYFKGATLKPKRNLSNKTFQLFVNFLMTP